jgi:23S rRNA (guanosine2251-2'-O)-methyltransferase
MLYYGINPLMESLQSEHLPEVVYVERGKSNARVDNILRTAERHGIPIEYVPDMNRLCDSTSHQGVAARLGDSLQRKLTELSHLSDHILLMDSIQDPHNFGAALRVCDAFGFHDVIYHTGNSSGLTPAAIKVSAGAAFHLNLWLSNLNSAVKRLKGAGYRILALDADSDQTIFSADYGSKFCLVIGSEGKGIRHNIRMEADAVLSIPMAGRVTSLNVSCALSAVLCEITRRSVTHQ